MIQAGVKYQAVLPYYMPDWAQAAAFQEAYGFSSFELHVREPVVLETGLTAELVEGVELRAMEEVIPEEVEGLFFFALAIGITNHTGKRPNP